MSTGRGQRSSFKQLYVFLFDGLASLVRPIYDSGVLGTLPTSPLDLSSRDYDSHSHDNGGWPAPSGGLSEVTSDHHEPSTSEILLSRVYDQRDRSAWIEFFTRYDALLRDFSRCLRLDQNTTDELLSIVWDRLWLKMQTFEYDPGKKFRHWLWIFYRRQALDYLKSRRRTRQHPVDFSSEDAELLLPSWCDRLRDEEPDEERNEGHARPEKRDLLLARAEMVQLIVRSRVKKTTWEAFWLVQIEGNTTEEAASILGMTYLAAFKASRRVAKMLETEGKKFLGPRSNEEMTEPKI